MTCNKCGAIIPFNMVLCQEIECRAVSYQGLTSEPESAMVNVDQEAYELILQEG